MHTAPEREPLLPSAAARPQPNVNESFSEQAEPEQQHDAEDPITKSPSPDAHFQILLAENPHLRSFVYVIQMITLDLVALVLILPGHWLATIYIGGIMSSIGYSTPGDLIHLPAQYANDNCSGRGPEPVIILSFIIVLAVVLACLGAVFQTMILPANTLPTWAVPLKIVAAWFLGSIWMVAFDYIVGLGSNLSIQLGVARRDR
ncbi:hypothetical protein LTR17_009179 [Elasticomyces elasticus]|nr:hypothetical protein LTR17_009179 [Elasticomyces elasticus]